jgi:YcxB-like protein
MTIHFAYDKNKVIQALRYHFISRPEIRIMIILVNVFALFSFALFAFGKITVAACLTFSALWIILMLSFWFFLPFAVYKRAVTFKHEFSMTFTDKEFSLIHNKGSKSWEWTALKNYLESPHFFHLYFDTRSFLLVPKEACADSDATHQLRKLIQANVKKASIKG